MDNDQLPKSLQEAKRTKSKFYFTNKICKNGHLSPRYTYCSHCVECLRLKRVNNKTYIKSYNKIYYKIHQQNRRDIQKKYYQENKEKIKKYIKYWQQNNPERIKQYNQTIKIKNKEKIKKYRSESRKIRRKNDSLWRLNSNISSAIWKSLKQNKNNKHWEELVKFTLSELKTHLENQFKKGMTWENYGKYWHVDHIKPISLCNSFEEAWQLINLQPLEASKNCSKGNRYVG